MIQISTVTENAKYIWDALIKAGCTREGASGVLGNLKHESGIIPNRVEILCLQRLREHGKTYTDATYTAAVDNGTISRAEFLHPLPSKQYGYGLAQWTSEGRKAGLYDLAKYRGVSIGDLEAQTDYLISELKGYISVWNVIISTEDIKAASDIVLKKFECPADTGSAVQYTRYNSAVSYFREFTSPTVTAKDVLDIMRGWLGYSEANGKWWNIVQIYNAHKPLARGYALNKSDSWCDATVSAAFIKAGDTALIGGTECGVHEHVQLFKKAGIWLGKCLPKTGDIITYDWKGDGYADHIGIVEAVSGTTITTIEGNYSDSVKRRTIAYNDKQISGYARPMYSAAKVETTTVSKAPVPSTTTVATKLTTILDCMKKYNARIKTGTERWGYYNTNTAPTWQNALDTKRYRVNCATIANWALKDLGALSTDAKFYGKLGGTVWMNAKAKAELPKSCDLIKIGNKTVQQLLNSGTLMPGDIVTYVNIQHTNIYAGNGFWYDAGHAYSYEGNGTANDGATWHTWYGDTRYASQLVGYIIRYKKTEPKGGLNETERWVGKVTASKLSVRSYAGTEYDRIKSYPYLLKGNLVSVCDEVKANNGDTWYFIKIADKYLGFVSSKYIAKA